MLTTVYLIFSLVLTIAYLMIIGLYVIGWIRLPLTKLLANYVPQTKVSVLVAARNEANTISRCLNGISSQNYPNNLFEILVIDDHSTDKTTEVVEMLRQQQNNLQLIRLIDFKNRQGKKQAIATGIAHSQGELIVTTDADCTMNKDWLRYLVQVYEQEKALFIAAPVVFHQEKSIFEQFQTLDFMGMMAITGAGIRAKFMHMCNGANLAYSKRVFEEVNGFEGIDHLASGDDMLLMQKVAKHYPEDIRFVKNKAASTYTYPKSTLKGFIQQRIRWASKSSAYTEWQVIAILGLVWLFSLSIVFDLILALSSAWWYLGLAILKLVLKGIADYFFLGMMTRFFERPKLMRAFLPALLLHWLYIVSIGFLSNVTSGYEWKNRRVK